MKNNVYKKLFNLKLLRNTITLYLYYRFEKGFDVVKKIKILKFAGDWDELQGKFFTQQNHGQIYKTKQRNQQN